LEQEDNATDAQSVQKPLVDAGNGNTLPEGAMSHWMVDPQMWSAGAYVPNYMTIIGENHNSFGYLIQQHISN
jgi:hypothetical protein